MPSSFQSVLSFLPILLYLPWCYVTCSDDELKECKLTSLKEKWRFYILRQRCPFLLCWVCDLLVYLFIVCTVNFLIQ